MKIVKSLTFSAFFAGLFSEKAQLLNGTSDETYKNRKKSADQPKTPSPEVHCGIVLQKPPSPREVSAKQTEGVPVPLR